MLRHLDDPFLSRDHAELDGLFAAIPLLDPTDLPACARRIAMAMSAHFAREEAAMAAAHFPGLGSHRDMHAALLAAVEDVASADLPADVLLRTLGDRIPRLVAHHEAEIDRLTSRYIADSGD